MSGTIGKKAFVDNKIQNIRIDSLENKVGDINVTTLNQLVATHDAEINELQARPSGGGTNGSIFSILSSSVADLNFVANPSTIAKTLTSSYQTVFNATTTPLTMMSIPSGNVSTDFDFTSDLNKELTAKLTVSTGSTVLYMLEMFIPAGNSSIIMSGVFGQKAFTSGETLTFKLELKSPHTQTVTVYPATEGQGKNLHVHTPVVIDTITSQLLTKEPKTKVIRLTKNGNNTFSGGFKTLQDAVNYYISSGESRGVIRENEGSTYSENCNLSGVMNLQIEGVGSAGRNHTCLSGVITYGNSHRITFKDVIIGNNSSTPRLVGMVGGTLTENGSPGVGIGKHIFHNVSFSMAAGVSPFDTLTANNFLTFDKVDFNGATINIGATPVMPFTSAASTDLGEVTFGFSNQANAPFNVGGIIVVSGASPAAYNGIWVVKQSNTNNVKVFSFTTGTATDFGAGMALQYNYFTNCTKGTINLGDGAQAFLFDCVTLKQGTMGTGSGFYPNAQLSVFALGLPYTKNQSVVIHNAKMYLCINNVAASALTPDVDTANWQQVGGGTIANNSITNSMLTQVAANTYKGNATGATANLQDISTKTAFNKDFNTLTTNILKADITSSLGSSGLVADASHVHPVNALDDLSNLSITTPAVGDILKYNGTTWTNSTTSNSVGAGTRTFYCTTPVVNGRVSPTGLSQDGTTGNGIQINTLSSTINTTAQQTIIGTVTSTALPNLSRPFIAWENISPLGKSLIDGGLWQFSINLVTSSTVTNFQRAMYQIVPGTVSVTISGAEANSRTATITSGQFAGTFFNANVSNLLSSWIRTPNGLFQITGVTDTNTVTITVPTGYVNETAVTFYIWNLLFITTAIALPTAATTQNISTYQSSFAVSTTDSLGSLDFITFVSGVTPKSVTMTYNGTANQNIINTPIAITHNSLAGLQGGDDTNFNHLGNPDYNAVINRTTNATASTLVVRDTNSAISSSIFVPNVVTVPDQTTNYQVPASILDTADIIEFAQTSSNILFTFADSSYGRRDITVRASNTATVPFDVLASGNTIPATGSQRSKRLSYTTSSGWTDIVSAVTNNAIYTVSQTSHGFTVGTVISRNDSLYTKALADTTSASGAVGIVTSVIDTNTFIYASDGNCDGFTGLVIGNEYFLSQTTSGAITDIPPTIGAYQSLGTAVTSTVLCFSPKQVFNLNQSNTALVFLSPLVPTMGGNSNSAVTITDSGNAGAGYEAWRAFDNTMPNTSNNTNAQALTIVATTFVRLLFTVPYTVLAYECRTSYPINRSATGWVLEGSNNGTTWTALDTRTNITWNGVSELKKFTVTTYGAYLNYRFRYTSGGDGTYIGLDSIQLYI